MFPYVLHINCSRYCLLYSKALIHARSTLYLFYYLLTRNWDMTQNMILQFCDLKLQGREWESWMSTVLCTAPCLLDTNSYTCEVSLRSYWFFSKMWGKTWLKGVQKEKQLTGETIWCTLTFCGTNYAIKGSTWHNNNLPLFDNISLNFIWHQLCSNTLSRYGNRTLCTFA